MSAWGDHITVAVLGTEKAAPPPLPAVLESAIPDLMDSDRETVFLTRAGALALWRRAGFKPTMNEAVLSPAPPESTTLVSQASLAHLRVMLGGRCSGVLPEWLRKVVDLARHVPPELLPALLDRARQDRALRPLALAAGGHRAQWLAVHNPDWAFARADSPELWETGDRGQRLSILRAIRRADPAEARTKIEAVWKVESADLRAAFLAELATNLSDDDEPFLECALEDRSKEVRRVAGDLLARLPLSSYVERMIRRATALLAFKRGGLMSRATMEVDLPSEPDAAGVRDGLDAKAFGSQKTLGEKAVLLVLILSAVPLRYWTDAFQAQPDAIIKAAEKNEFAKALATGWAWAALRQRDAVWAEALLNSKVQPHMEFLPPEPLFTLLPEPARAERLSAMILNGALKTMGSTEWIAALAELTVFAESLPEGIGRKAIDALRGSLTQGLPWHFRSPVEAWLLRLPPTLLAEAAQGWPTEREGISGLVELLTFRHDALTTLTLP